MFETMKRFFLYINNDVSKKYFKMICFVIIKAFYVSDTSVNL